MTGARPLDVVYVTYGSPDGSPSSDIHVDTDLPLVLDALSRLGATCAAVPWDAPGFDWASAGLALVRSPWDYVLRRDEFVAWAHRTGSLTRLENPAQVLEHNTDKRYLRELVARGVPVVPTAWIESDADVEAAIATTVAEHHERVVVKPTVSASARDTIVTAEPATAASHARGVLARGHAVMVQPYLDAVDGEGEISLLVVDGVITHAVRKVPALTEGGGGDAEGAVDVTAELEAAARAVLAAADAEGLLYARVDLVRDAAGGLVLMELELTEPSLFLTHSPEAAGTLARAALARLA